MAFCIGTFSSALCLAHATDQGLDELPSNYFEVTEHSNDVYGVIDKLNEIFEQEFQSILDKMVTDETIASFDSFMKATLSRYVIMSKTPTYFYFMLLSSLVEKVAFYVFTETQCYTFAKVTSLSLRAAYDRSYKDMFKKEFESLGCYCRRINPLLLSEESKSEFSIYPQQKIRSLLESLLDVDYENFTLTVSEEAMLNDILNLVKLEESLADIIVSMEVSDKYASASTDKSCIKKMSCLNLNDYSSRKSRICEYCGGKCFAILLSYLEKPLLSNL